MRRVNTDQLRPGMIIAEDIYAPNGQLIIAKGTKLTDATLGLLSRNAVLSSRIDDSAKGASASSQKREEDIYKGDDIPGFTSNLPEHLSGSPCQTDQRTEKSYTEGLNFFQISINNLVVKNTDMDVDSIIDQTLATLGSNGKGTNILQMLVFMQEYDSNVYAHSVNVPSFAICWPAGLGTAMRTAVWPLPAVCSMISESSRYRKKSCKSPAL